VIEIYNNMHTKHYVFLGVTLIALILGGFFILNKHIYQEKQPPNPSVQSDLTLTGVVTSVDIEQMMVDGPAVVSIITSAGEMYDVLLPSMGRGTCDSGDEVASVSYVQEGSVIEVRGELSEEGIVPCSSSAHYLRVYERVVDANAKFEFIYKTAPLGYVPFTDEGIGTDPDFVSGFVLMSEYGSKELAAMPDFVGEYPPTMQGRVYKNVANETAEEWIMSHPLESNIEFAISKPRKVMMGYHEAVAFTWVGLYAANVYVITNQDLVYLFIGGYSDGAEDAIKDFDNLVQSVVFNK